MINPFSKSGYVRTATRKWRRQFPYRVETAVTAFRAGFSRRRFRGRVIAVTGSSAKTTTTSLIGHILEAVGPTRVRAMENSLLHVSQTLVSTKPGDMFAVIETATSEKGMIARKARLIRPHVAVVTLVAVEHYTAFRSIEAIADEKADLVRAVPDDGIVILNNDDERVAAMASLTAARKVTFGRTVGSDYRILSVDHAFPDPLRIRLQFADRSIELESRLIGQHFWLPVVAAFVAAVETGVDPELAAARISSFEPVFNRMSVIRVPGGPNFLMDATKAPRASLDLAFDVVANAPAPFKRIVVGSISDYPGNPRKVYRGAYRAAAAAADEVIFVGPNSHRSGASEEDRTAGRFLEMPDARAVFDHVSRTARPGEVILLKGSIRDHLERVGLAFADEVRCWIPACGFTIGCLNCGLYRIPFEEHGKFRKRNGRARWKRYLGLGSKASNE